MPDGFDRLVREAERVSFAGWDFGWIRERMVEEPRAWDYAAVVRAAFPGTTALLDVGTGGGERLAAMAPLPAATCATETYPPNVPVARARLEPLGVRVVAAASDDALPFADAAFDLVIDRHTGAPAAEVHRVLRPAGRFITQQVGGQHNRELAAWLDASAGERSSPSLQSFRREMEGAGFTAVQSRECFPPTHLLDVGALVYYLRAIAWAVPGFSPERHRERLRAIHEHIRAHGELRLTGHYLLFEAVRGGGATDAHRRGVGPQRG